MADRAGGSMVVGGGASASERRGWLARALVPPKRGKWKFFARWAAVVVAALPVAVVVLAHTPVPRWVFESVCTKIVRVPARAESLRLGWSSAVLRGLTLRVPEVAGPAGEFLRVDEVRARMDWWQALTGSGGVTLVEMSDPLVRVSQDVRTGSLNVSALPPFVAQHPRFRLPEIRVSGATMELGEHDGASYVELRRLAVGGQFQSSARERGQYVFDLRETSPAEEGPGLRIEGRVDVAGLDVTLSGLAIERWSGPSAPRRLRPMLDAMELSGRVAQAQFSYRAGQTVGPTLVLEDVGVTLPVPAEEGSGPNLRMTSTRGRITFTDKGVRANFEGMLRDLPYTVELDYRGFDEDAGFVCVLNCRDFQLERHPDLLPYAPALVRTNLARFSNPTALVDASVRISRADPSGNQPGELSTEGWLEFRGGTAAWARFPYRFFDMSGRVSFSDERIDIERIEGVSQRGATLRATGWIAPLDADPAAELRISARGVSIDDELRQAMGASWNTMLDAAMSDEELARLQELGIVRADGAAEGPGRPFELGGVAGIDMVLTHAGGHKHEWKYRVDAGFARVGVLPAAMPIPMVGRDVVLAIEPQRVWLERGTWSTLDGGEVRVQATVLRDRSAPARPVVPEVDIGWESLSIGPMLEAALPRPIGLRPAKGVEDEAGETTPTMIAALGLSGQISARTTVRDRGDGTPRYEANIDLLDCAITPADAGAGARKVRGRIEASESRVMLEASGLVCGVADRTGGDLLEEGGEAIVRVVAERAEQQLEVEGGAQQGTQIPWRTRASVDVRSLDVSLAIEEAIRPVSPGMAGWMASQRVKLRPTGVASTSMSIEAEAGSVAGWVTVEPEQAVSVRAGEHEVVLDQPSGSVRVAFRAQPQGDSTGEGGGGRPVMVESVELAGLEAGVGLRRWADGEDGVAAPMSLGRWSANGGWGRGSEATSVRMNVRGGRLDPSAAQGVASIARELGADLGVLASRVEALQLWAGFDGEVEIAKVASGLAAAGEVRPTAVAMRVEGTAVDLPSLAGALVVDATRGKEGEGWRIAGSMRGLRAEADDVTLDVSGPFAIDAEGWTVQLGVGLEVRDASALAARLPGPVRERIERMAITGDRPVRVEGGAVALASNGQGGVDVRTHGSADLDVRSMLLGEDVRLADVVGIVEWSSAWLGDRSWWDVSLRADRLRAGGVRATSVVAKAGRAENQRDVRIELGEASVHGGRMVGSGVLKPGAGDDKGTLAEVDVQASGVLLSALLGDLSRAREEHEPALVSGEASAPSEASGSGARDPAAGELADGARVSGSARLGWTLGETGTRRGRGDAQVAGGEIVRVPLVMPLIELLNLQMPANETLDVGRARFFLDGDRLAFEELGVYSRSLVMPAFGTMDLRTGELDLRVFSRGARQVPIVGQLLEAIRNELVSVRVTGRLDKPNFSLQTLRGTRNWVGQSVGRRDGTPSELLERGELLLRSGPGGATDGAEAGVLRPIGAGMEREQPPDG